MKRWLPAGEEGHSQLSHRSKLPASTNHYHEGIICSRTGEETPCRKYPLSRGSPRLQPPSGSREIRELTVGEHYTVREPFAEVLAAHTSHQSCCRRRAGEDREAGNLGAAGKETRGREKRKQIG
ncbi:uncharacterized protein LOC121970023 isoform X2 [Zingiber officinale]|uniref:uncharacterized protein LOC121970023 isoform X2 n=1 Tax=Zingiber officinale TaxID=94328 RepID=UPI001C4C107F|nr:uncharacterized protein LOC121970023 isoform X2 [Zingiber officinale]